MGELRTTQDVSENLLLLSERDVADMVEQCLDRELEHGSDEYQAGYADGVFTLLQVMDLKG